MNTDDKHERHDERPQAVQQAEAGAVAWRAAVHAQRSATPDHSDFYGLAGSLLDTFLAVEALARVLMVQIEAYPERLGHGQRLYDDTRATDPRDRLAEALADLDDIAAEMHAAAGWADRFWSAIGHIGVEDTPTPDDPTDGEVSL